MWSWFPSGHVSSITKGGTLLKGLWGANIIVTHKSEKYGQKKANYRSGFFVNINAKQLIKTPAKFCLPHAGS